MDGRFRCRVLLPSLACYYIALVCFDISSLFNASTLIRCILFFHHVAAYLLALVSYARLHLALLVLLPSLHLFSFFCTFFSLFLLTICHYYPITPPFINLLPLAFFRFPPFLFSFSLLSFDYSFHVLWLIAFLSSSLLLPFFLFGTHLVMFLFCSMFFVERCLKLG